MSVRLKVLLPVVVGTFVLITAYTNCGMVGSSHSVSSSASSSSSSSPSSDTLKAACQDGIAQAFATSYYPIVSRSGSCVKCHAGNGPSTHAFASPNLDTAFAAFMDVTFDQVDKNAISPTHASGVTGPGLQKDITSAHQTWDPAYLQYQECLVQVAPSNPPPSDANEALTLIERSTPELYFSDRRTVTLSWGLSAEQATPSNRRVPATFLMDIKVDYSAAGELIGYVFTNPRIQMLTGELELEVEGVVVRINGQKATNSEPFLSARKIARGVDATKNILYSGSIRVPRNQVSTGDLISVGLGFLNARARTDNPPVPATPTLSGSPVNVRNVAVNVTVTNDPTAMRWCLTTVPTRPTSTAVSCPGFESATTSGWLLARPTTFNLTAAGLIPQPMQTIRVYLWVANSDLKINATAGTFDFNFDTVVPSAPTLANPSLGATQIVDINLGNSNETVQWCIAQGSTAASVTANTPCGNNSFSPIKPTSVGLRSGGVVFLAAYVRDGAGNVSAAPMAAAVATVNNTYGKIRYDDLTNPSLGARAVFANACVSCHRPAADGGNAAAVAKVNLIRSVGGDASGYQSANGKKTDIQTLMNNSAPSAPHVGIVSDKDKALVNLWVTQNGSAAAEQ